jgi:hypothetical protein
MHIRAKETKKRRWATILMTLLFMMGVLVPIAQRGTPDAVYPMTCEKLGTINVPTLVARGG